MGPLTPNWWHARFVQQARWTQELRQYLYGRTGLTEGGRLLEVGCGTGALLPEFANQTQEGRVYGLDIAKAFLTLASQNASLARLTQGDAHTLPYAGHSFDVAACHFLLLWVHDPMQVIKEMRRVTRPGGVVLLLAEPDYGGRIDFPLELAQLGRWQEQALRSQSADPTIGRRLAALLHRAGVQELEAGVLGGQWSAPPPLEAWQSEWQVLEADLADIVSQEKLEQLRSLDAVAWESGERILYVPTFYAWGRVP